MSQKALTNSLASLLDPNPLIAEMIKYIREQNNLGPVPANEYQLEVKAAERVKTKIAVELMKRPHRICLPSYEQIYWGLTYMYENAHPNIKKGMISMRYISRNFIKIFKTSPKYEEKNNIGRKV